jgi:hypothetical protein
MGKYLGGPARTNGLECSRVWSIHPGRKPMSSRIESCTAPARIHAFVECPNCGFIPKLTHEAMVGAGMEGLDHVHCHFRCERCGSDKALLHLTREILSRH